MADTLREPRIPKRLRREPLIEVIWQAVFEASSQLYPGDLLGGILYAELRKASEAWVFQRLPTAEIPPFIADQDPNLRYAVRYRIESPDEPVLYQVGNRILSVNCRRPYVGWEAFRAKILSIQKLLERNGIVPGPSWHALRYLDLISREDMPDLSGLHLSLQVGDQEILTQPLQLRVEFPYQGQIHILQILTHAQVHLKEGKQEGTLIDLETRAFSSQDWSRIPKQLEDLHSASKAVFFQQVLKPEIIERFDPEY